ncbi:hypothetical protein KR084_007874 [Drosophila pseudotakahashii]|nr:hypothetical protein KR084_007874 [Drosophila pseudotakahashii]
MKLLCWESFGCFMANILPKSFSWSGGEMKTLSVVNQSQEMLEDSIGCCSMHWLVQLQQSSCPLMKLLILGLLALPVYNAILILVGWRLNCSASSSAERLVLDIRVPKALKRPAPPPPAAPRPPPRLRRRKRQKTPLSIRKLRLPESYPSQKNPFDSSLQADQYKNLKENLKMVLEGLQKPLPASTLLPIFVPPEVEPLTPPESPRIESKKPSSKFLPGILKRLWQRWKTQTRKKEKKTSISEASTSSSSSSSSLGSTCFYVY